MPGPAGIEAGAREARYAALAELAEHLERAVVLLGHTLDDQAETVLLGLTRGSGGRSLQGMRRRFLEPGGRTAFARPLLDLTRAQTEAACRAEGIAVVGGPAQRRPPVHPVADPHDGACRCSSASWVPGSRRRSLGRRTSCARTWTSSSRSSRPPTSGRGRGRRRRPGRRSTTSGRRSGPGRAAGGDRGRRERLGADPRARAGGAAAARREGQGRPAPRAPHGVRRRRCAAIPAHRTSAVKRCYGVFTRRTTQVLRHSAAPVAGPGGAWHRSRADGSTAVLLSQMRVRARVHTP